MPGAEIMLSDFTGAEKVYIACGYTDLRKGIDGLAATVQQQFQLDRSPTRCFCSAADGGTASRGSTGSGMDLSCCISVGTGCIPMARTENEVRQLTPQQYRWLMEGLKVEQLKAHRPVDGLRII